MKPPDDPVPSGDRTMARQLFKALELADHDVELVSRLKCRVRTPDALQDLRSEVAAEIDHIAARWKTAGAPQLIVTYHVYYKSPDLVGAALAQRFRIPYVTIEASFAGKRDRDEWASVQEISSAAIRQAALNICFTPRDAEGVLKLVAPERIAMLPPFADFSGIVSQFGAADTDGPVELLSVAMMLKGNKLESFRLLADALRQLKSTDWRLTIVGDGSMRPAVETMFSDIPGVRIVGQADRAGVAGHLANSDVFVWPGYREAFGLAYLEAQGAGLPVVAMNSGGVETVVKPGVTGVLVPEGDTAGFAGAVDALIQDRPRRQAMGRQARSFARQERDISVVARQLDDMLRGVLSR